jgi:hypothetical protein
MTTRPHTAIEHYDQILCREHLASTCEHLARGTQERDLVFLGRPVCEVLRPFFLPGAMYDEVCRAASLVARGLTVLSKQLARDEAWRGALGLTPAEEALLRLDPGEPTELVGRLDGFLGCDGVIRFIEYNPVPAGIFDGDELCEVFGGMPIMRRFRELHPVRSVPLRHRVLDALVRTHARKGGAGVPNVAVVTDALATEDAPASSLLALPEMIKMLNLLREGGVDVRPCRSSDLTRRSQHLMAGDFRIDAVMITDWAQFIAGVSEDSAFWRAIAAGEAWIVNSAATAILRGSKSVFALLSDPDHAHLFEPEVAAALARHVPWTRRIADGPVSYGDASVDLVGFVLANRNRLVLKPADEFGGKGVVLGWQCDDETWRASLARALSNPSVVQERVQVDTEAYPSVVSGSLRFEPRRFDLDPFIWNDEHASGCCVRVSTTTITNLTAGDASQAAFFLIDGGAVDSRRSGSGA